MKRIILLLLLIGTFNTFASAQVNNFFLSDDDKVVWQKVFETECSFDELYDRVNTSGTFDNIATDGSIITCRIVRGKVDYRKYGYEWGDLPLLVTATDISCFATIQVKEGRYRVTVENLILRENTTRGLFKEGTENAIEKLAIKKGSLSKAFIGNTSALYDNYLTETFSMAEKSYLNDEW